MVLCGRKVSMKHLAHTAPSPEAEAAEGDPIHQLPLVIRKVDSQSSRRSLSRRLCRPPFMRLSGRLCYLLCRPLCCVLSVHCRGVSWHGLRGLRAHGAAAQLQLYQVHSQNCGAVDWRACPASQRRRGFSSRLFAALCVSVGSNNYIYI